MPREQMIRRIIPWYRALPLWLQALLAGSALGVSFISPGTAPLVLVGLALFLLSLHCISTLRTAAWFGVRVGFVQALFVLQFFWTAYPLQWVAVSSDVLQLALIACFWIVGALSVSIGWGVSAAAYVQLARLSLPTPILATFTAAIFVGAEILNSLLHSILVSGAGSTTNIFFGMTYVGNPVSQLPFTIHLAQVGGVYILTAVGVWCMVVLVSSSPQRAKILVAVIGLLILSSVATQRWGGTEQQFAGTVAIVETYFTAEQILSPTGQSEKQASLHQAVIAAFAQEPDFIILPEDSRYLQERYTSVSVRQARTFFHFEFQNPTATLVDSGRYESPTGAAHLRATVVRGGNSEPIQYDKQLLVPLGEYTPFLAQGILKVFASPAQRQQLEQRQGYQPGPNPVVPATGVPLVLFCYEGINPLGVRRLGVDESVPFVAHPMSHAWFHSPHSYWHQIDVALRIQAVWNQIPIIGATNLGPSHVYTPSGTVQLGEVVATGEGWKVYVVDLASL